MNSDAKATSWRRAFRLALLWVVPSGLLATCGVNWIAAAPENIRALNDAEHYILWLGNLAIGLLLINLGLLAPGWAHRSWKAASLLGLLEIVAVWLMFGVLWFMGRFVAQH
jgi:hypothetical protein